VAVLSAIFHFFYHFGIISARFCAIEAVRKKHEKRAKRIDKPFDL